MLESGLAEDEVLHLVHAGVSLTVGYLWLEAGGFVGELPEDAPFLRRHAAETAPASAEAFIVQAPPWSRDEDFSAGLDLLLADPTSGQRRRRGGRAGPVG